MDRWERRAAAANKRMDRVDKQLKATQKLAEEAGKLVFSELPKDTLKLRLSPETFQEWFRKATRG
jgi:hypothetical protein